MRFIDRYRQLGEWGGGASLCSYDAGIELFHEPEPDGHFSLEICSTYWVGDA